MSPHNIITCLFPLCSTTRITTLEEENEVRTTEKIWYVSLALECSVHTFLNSFSYVVDLLFVLMQHELPFYYPGQVMFELFCCSFYFQKV